jgi:hypothetical protein
MYTIPAAIPAARVRQPLQAADDCSGTPAGGLSAAARRCRH